MAIGINFNFNTSLPQKKMPNSNLTPKLQQRKKLPQLQLRYAISALAQHDVFGIVEQTAKRMKKYKIMYNTAREGELANCCIATYPLMPN